MFFFNLCESDYCIFLVLERTEYNLLKINWLCGVIQLHSNSVGALGQVFIVSHSYQTYFGFPESDFNLDYGLHGHMIMRFASEDLTPTK
jgi:hypothetical protein